MLSDCFCMGHIRRIISSKCKHYRLVSSRILPEEINLLSLIFEDLATRNPPDSKLTYENFVNFVGLTGLWASHLFHLFDETSTSLLGFEEFLYGIAISIKAPLDDKLKLLYSFFESDPTAGIQFKNFVKMFHNYSKDELKEILRDNISSTLTQTSLSLFSGSDIELNLCGKALDSLALPKLAEKPSCTFEEAYQTLIKVHDEGTYLEINSTSSHSCKVKCENMSAYVKQFASKVYQQHSLAPFPPDNRLKYDQFANWVQEDKKLYKSFFSSFHTEIWTNDDGEPRYLTSKADLEFVGRIECGKIRGEVYGFQIKDMIVFCESAKTKGKAIKIVCLEGLTITDLGNLSLEIAHRSDHYRNCVMVFRRAEEHEEWMVSLRRYQKESLNLNYMIGEVIGTGKFSTVYKCTNKNSNKVFALKAIDLRKLSKKAVDAIRNESEILKIINHPQVLKYHETINTKTHEYIITEYIYGEDLFEYVRKRSRLNEFESAFIIGNIMKAVIYLHELDIMHRDLKPENIMIMFKEIREGEYFECTSAHIRKGQRIENIKIIDFGISDHLSDLAKIEKTKLLAGTPNYIAPEIILGEPLTLKSDIFAIGSILYFMLKGTLPFAERNSEKTLLNTVAGRCDLESEHWDHISCQAKSLLRGLLAVDPTERIELSEAINHEWFSCISNQAKTKSSASSVSDTNDSLKLNSRKLEDARSCTAQNFQVSRKERKISTSLPKEKNKGNPKEKGKETEKEVERNMEKQRNSK